LHSLSSFTDDIGLRREPKGSALPKFPSSVSDGGMVSRLHWFAASLRPVELLAPLYGSDQEFPQPTGTFTPELSASRSPFSSSGITTVATERFHRWDFHPLEYQLASLHGLLHPLQHAGLARRTPVGPSFRRYSELGVPLWASGVAAQLTGDHYRAGGTSRAFSQAGDKFDGCDARQKQVRRGFGGHES
jgi:hypothetical protein